MSRILIIEDETNLRGSLKLLFDIEGYEVDDAKDGLEGLSLFKTNTYDAILTDVKMPQMGGLEVLREVRKLDPLMPVILITAFASIDDVIIAMREGAYNYIKKPFENEEVILQVKKAIEERRLHSQIAYLRDEIDRNYPFKSIIGHSSAMESVFELIRRVAPSKSTVLVTGESGTGKELVARAIHDNSPRRDKPMVKVNCVAIPDTLLESELFGHVKGAFTDASYTKPGKFELADGGTIFLDEIGDMSLALQGKILRVLQEREYEPVGGTGVKKVDVRIIAATNRPLKQQVREGKFREDLYFRLNVVPIQLPALRQRKEDIPELTQYFIGKYSQICGKEIQSISPEATIWLRQYDYPGNVRELENLIERAVVLCMGNALELGDFQFNISRPSMSTLEKDSFVHLPFREAKRIVLENFEKQFIISALIKSRGNVSQAAKLVDMDRNNFKDKLQQYEIRPTDYTEEQE